MVNCPNCQHEFEPIDYAKITTASSTAWNPASVSASGCPTIFFILGCTDCGASFPTCAVQSARNPHLCTSCEQKKKAIDAS